MKKANSIFWKIFFSLLGAFVVFLLLINYGVFGPLPSLKELEKIYNVNENALKVRLFRARQRVLKNMKDVTPPSSRVAKNNDAA